MQVDSLAIGDLQLGQDDRARGGDTNVPFRRKGCALGHGEVGAAQVNDHIALGVQIAGELDVLNALTHGDGHPIGCLHLVHAEGRNVDGVEGVVSSICVAIIEGRPEDRVEVAFVRNDGNDTGCLDIPRRVRLPA